MPYRYDCLECNAIFFEEEEPNPVLCRDCKNAYDSEKTVTKGPSTEKTGTGSCHK